MKPNLNRIVILDALRGFAIILVVLSHILQFTYFPHQDELFIFKVIESFYMPLFMFISGFIGFITLNFNTPLKNIWKKFIALGVPFLSWYFIVSYILQDNYKRFTLQEEINSIIKSTDNGMWFLWTLFLCFVVLNITIILYRSKIFKRKYIDILFYGILGWYILHTPYTAFGWGFVRWYFLFFIVGFLTSKYKDDLKKYIKIIKEVAIVGFPLLVVGWSRIHSPDIIPFLAEHLHLFRALATVEIVYNFATAMAGIAFFYFVIKEVIRIKLFERILSYLGKYSLDIYVMHIFFVGFFNTSVNILGTNFFPIFLDTISGILVSILMSNLFLRQSKIFKFIFLGQYDKKHSKN